MKNKFLSASIFLFILVCFLSVSGIAHAAFISWNVNGASTVGTYNPGDTIDVSGTISSTLCSISVAAIHAYS
jgi:type 1 fimbria pilin